MAPRSGPRTDWSGSECSRPRRSTQHGSNDPARKHAGLEVSAHPAAQPRPHVRPAGAGTCGDLHRRRPTGPSAHTHHQEIPAAVKAAGLDLEGDLRLDWSGSNCSRSHRGTQHGSNNPPNTHCPESVAVEAAGLVLVGDPSLSWTV